MPSTSAIAAKQAQDLRAQTLSTLMATVDPVGNIAKVVGNLTGSVEAAMQSVDAAIRAVIVENSGNGRAILQVPGGMVEAELPPALLRAALTNPNLLKPGSTVMLPADSPARALPPPATMVDLHGLATGPSVGPAPPLASPFPPGTLGAAIARLVGIAFPQAEPEALMAPNLPAGTPSLRPGMLSQPMPPDIAEALLRAASRQMPLASAVTQILAAGEAEMAHLPPDLAAALRALHNARTTPEALRTSEGVQNAVKLSGLFLESNLAQTAPGQSVPADLKSILLALRTLVGGDALRAEPGPGKPAVPNELAGRSAPQEAAARPPSERLPELARAVEGAVERVKLMQLASMPEHPEIRVTDDRAQPMRLALSIPIATQGQDRPPTAVMGLMIEHRPQTAEAAPYEAEKDGSGDTEPFPWKVRIALDLEETGPVQAEIALRGQSVAVTLWAERTSMASLARESIGALHEALTGAAFDVFKLEVKDGRPQGKPVPRGPVLDRRT